jgi:hypothetical protein
MDVIHLFVLFEHWCHVHYLNTDVICMFVLFKHECYVSIRIIYTWKLCTWISCLNNAWHSCVNNMNPWNNKFCTNLEWTHETFKFIMYGKQKFMVLSQKTSKAQMWAITKVVTYTLNSIISIYLWISPGATSCCQMLW